MTQCFVWAGSVRGSTQLGVGLWWSDTRLNTLKAFLFQLLVFPRKLPTSPPVLFLACPADLENYAFLWIYGWVPFSCYRLLKAKRLTFSFIHDNISWGKNGANVIMPWVKLLLLAMSASTLKCHSDPASG